MISSIGKTILPVKIGRPLRLIVHASPLFNLGETAKPEIEYILNTSSIKGKVLEIMDGVYTSYLDLPNRQRVWASAGFISDQLFKERPEFKSQTYILMGGNFISCLKTTWRCIIDHKLWGGQKPVIFHFPLKAIYMSKSPTADILNRINPYYENPLENRGITYSSFLDGQVRTSTLQPNRKSAVLLYFWSESEDMFKAFGLLPLFRFHCNL